MSRVLVADDDTDNRALLESVLATMGFEVVTAVTGDDALALARQRRIGAAVLDVRMPGLSGIDVCRALRADARTTALPVLLVSACATAATIVAGFDAGADDYLVKPFKIRELSGRVSALMSGATRRAQAPLAPGLLAALSTRATAASALPLPQSQPNRRSAAG